MTISKVQYLENETVAEFLTLTLQYSQCSDISVGWRLHKVEYRARVLLQRGKQYVGKQRTQMDRTTTYIITRPCCT